VLLFVLGFVLALLLGEVIRNETAHGIVAGIIVFVSIMVGGEWTGRALDRQAARDLERERQRLVECVESAVGEALAARYPEGSATPGAEAPGEQPPSSPSGPDKPKKA
jgi:hypothetical protein